MQREELSTITTLIACMQLVNHEFLVFISSFILIRSGDRYFDRIDACEAWMIIHFLVAIGNGSLLTFEFMDDEMVVINASILKKLLIGWKLLFLAVEIFGIIYCFHIVHIPVVYLKKKKRRTPHPLFSSHDTRSRDSMQEQQRNTINGTTSNVTSQRPRSLLLPNQEEVQFPSNSLSRQQTNHSRQTRNSCYESYQSLTSGANVETPVRYSRNPAYESENSLNHADNFSHYEQTVQPGRNRISYYVEPIRESSAENGNDYGAIVYWMSILENGNVQNSGYGCL